MVEMDFKKQLHSMKRILDFAVKSAICSIAKSGFRSAILESLIKKKPKTKQSLQILFPFSCNLVTRKCGETID